MKTNFKKNDETEIKKESNEEPIKKDLTKEEFEEFIIKSGAKGSFMVYRSDKKDEDAENLYRGISYRKFDRRFTLSEDIVVNGAKLENGMLTIELERIVPEEKKPRLIEVK